jgi:hypothetical protein
MGASVHVRVLMGSLCIGPRASVRSCEWDKCNERDRKMPSKDRILSRFMELCVLAVSAAIADCFCDRCTLLISSSDGGPKKFVGEVFS